MHKHIALHAFDELAVVQRQEGPRWQSDGHIRVRIFEKQLARIPGNLQPDDFGWIVGEELVAYTMILLGEHFESFSHTSLDIVAQYLCSRRGRGL
jgi:hypothetical protein